MWTVIHDGDTGMERLHDGFGIGLKQPMVGGEIKVNRSNQVLRTYQLPLFSFCEVAEVDEPEFAVGNQYSKRARVFCDVGFRFRLGSTDRVELVRARKRISNVLPCGSECFHGHTFEWQPVSRLQHQMLALANCFLVVGIELS